MIVQKSVFNDPDGSLGWIECIFESSNILTSTYFPKTQTLYLAFNRGGVYTYYNIDELFYNKFESSDSQGKFFINEIKNNNKFPCEKSFKLFESEISKAKIVIEEWKKTQENLQQQNF